MVRVLGEGFEVFDPNSVWSPARYMPAVCELKYISGKDENGLPKVSKLRQKCLFLDRNP